MEVRKLMTFIEEVRIEEDRQDGKPLVKAAAAAVIDNPYAGHRYSDDLSLLIQPSAELGRVLGQRAAEALSTPVESHGKAALVGTAGVQEHAIATQTTVAGDSFREATGGREWMPSVSKRCAVGVAVDVPLSSNRAIWVASHYDSIAVAVLDAPLPDEIVVIFAVASRGRLNARLGGMTQAEAEAASRG